MCFFLNLSTGLLHHVLKRGWGLILNVVKAPIWKSYISTLEKGQLGERNDSRAACLGGKGGERKIEIGATEC